MLLRVFFYLGKKNKGLTYFYLFGGDLTLSSAQRLLFALCSSITLGSAWKAFWDAGIKSAFATCKANALPTLCTNFQIEGVKRRMFSSTVEWK